MGGRLLALRRLLQRRAYPQRPVALLVLLAQLRLELSIPVLQPPSVGHGTNLILVNGEHLIWKRISPPIRAHLSKPPSSTVTRIYILYFAPRLLFLCITKTD